MSGQSARLGLAVGGAVIGGIFFGGVGARIGFTLGNLIGGALFSDEREGPTVEGPRLNDLTVSSSAYGQGIPITYGSVRVPGNVIWATAIMEVRQEESVDGGGGGGGGKGGSPPSGTQVTYEYFGNFAVAFGAGPVELIRTVYMDGKLVIDLSDRVDRGGLFLYGQQHYRMYTGTEEQLPDSLIEAHEGVGNVPGHRGLVYVVFDSLPLKDFGNRIPSSISAEVVADAPANFDQESFNIQTGSHDSDSTRLDFSAPFAITATTSGRQVTKFNRLTGTEFFNFNTGDSAALLGKMTSLGVNTNVAVGGVGAAIVDPVIGDITIGQEGTTFQGGGFSVWDKNGKFITYRHLGSFGSPRSGVVFSADSGFSRVLVSASGFRGNEVHVYKWYPDPTDPQDERGTLSTTSVGDYTAPTTSSLQTYIDFAVDPTKGGERCWGIRGTTGSGAAPPAIVQINGDGSIGADTTISGITSDPLGISYDIITDTLLVVTDSAVYKLDPDTYAILDQIGDGVAASDGGNVGDTGVSESLMVNQPTVQGLLHTLTTRETTDPGGSVNLVRIYTVDLSILNRYNNNSLFAPDGIWITGGVFWDPIIPALWSTAGGYIKYYFDRYGANGVPLASILTDLCSRAGLGASDIETSTITDTVLGYIVENPTSIRSAITPLQQAFFFDGAEINFKLAFVKRGGASVASIPYTDLAAKTEGSEQEPKIDEPRRQEVEVPRRVVVSYLNQENDYMISTQMEQRILHNPGDALEGVTQSREEVSYRLPIVMTDQQARVTAAVNLGQAWVERTTLAFKLPPKWVRLDPTDPIVVEKVSSALTASLNCRLTQVEIGDGGVMACQAVLNDAAVFTPNVTATASPTNAAGPIPVPVGTEMFLLNLPNLRGLIDEVGAAWFAASPAYQVPVPDWQGAQLSRAEDPNGPYSGVATVVRRSTWGLIKGIFGVSERYTVFDDKNVLEVELVFENDLINATDDAVLAGANIVYIESTGEIIQFGTAEQIGDTRWRLSHLLRGRYGTEYAIAETEENDKAVFIDTTVMGQFGDLDDYTFVRYYIGTTLASANKTTAVRAFTNQSESLRPWSPTNVLGSRAVSGGDLTITWQRRTRYNGELKDLVDVPLNESSESYEVDVLSQVDPYFDDVQLLLTLNGADGATSTTDASANARAITFFGDAQLDTAEFKFGAASLLCDGTGDYIEAPFVSGLLLTAATWTAECHVRFNSLTGDQALMGRWASAFERTWRLMKENTTDDLKFSWTTDGFTEQSFTATWAPSTGVWYHVVVERDDANLVTVYVDGVSIGSMVVSDTFDVSGISEPQFGSSTIGSAHLNGWLDNIRITSGSFRYGGDFVAPVIEYPESATERNVLRTIGPVPSETAVYEAADQVTDGYIPGVPVAVDVYQISELVGRGHPRRALL